VDGDSRSMISKSLRFFRIGFLLSKESDFDIPTPVIDAGGVGNLAKLVWRGPYNHVTSQSFSLVHFNKVRNTLEYRSCKSYQFTDSGGTDLSWYFDFAHARHDAFSSLALLLHTFRFERICFRVDQISSSFQA
jgi:hypothetical protein